LEFWKGAKRWLPGAVISLVLIGAILYFVDLDEMAEAVRRANYVLLGMAAVLSFVWIGVRAIVWRILLRERASYKDVFFTIGEGYLLNNILPFRLGEIGRAFLLSRKSNLQFLEVLPTIVIERAMDLGFSAAILLLSLPFIVGGEASRRIGIIIAGLVLLGLVILYMLVRKREWALNQFHRLSQRWPALQRMGASVLESFFEGLAVLKDGWLFARFLFWMTINWVLGILSYYLMVKAFFPQAPLAWGMFALGAAAFGNAIPSLPGNVGTFDGAFGGALTLLSGDQSTSFTVAFAGRIYNYLNSTVVGGIGLGREGQTLSGIYRQLMNFRNREKVQESE
jgi:uncharacterized protein (TIRG00374 family)